MKEDLLLKLISQQVKEPVVTLVTTNHFHLDQIITLRSISDESEIYFIYHYPKPIEINENQKNT